MEGREREGTPKGLLTHHVQNPEKYLAENNVTTVTARSFV